MQRCINRHTTTPRAKKYPVVYKKINAMLERHFAANRPPAFFAGQMHITPHHLNEVIKSVTGKTTSDLVRAHNLLGTKPLLTFAEYNMADIAEVLSYFDGVGCSAKTKCQHTARLFILNLNSDKFKPRPFLRKFVSE